MTRKYVVGYYCPRGSGHFELFQDEDCDRPYDASCADKGWDVVIEVEDGDDESELPEGYFE